jgi:hypothetical protein
LRRTDLLQSLDTLRLLTRGEPFNLRNLIHSISPPIEQYIGYCDNDPQRPCYAQVISRVDETQGQLTFLGALPDTDQSNIACLLENLISNAGKWGTHYITCDLPVNSPHLPGFKKAGFLTWANQTVFQISPVRSESSKPQSAWRTWNANDMRAMTSLYRGVVPGLLQPIEPLTRKTALGMVLYHPEGELLGYADLDYGPKGVWLQPVLSPEANDPKILSGLIDAIPDLYNRPVFLAARSYQPWLSSLAAQLPGEVQGSQLLMVRYLVRQLKVAEPHAFALYETGNIERGVPVSQIRQKAD